MKFKTLKESKKICLLFAKSNISPKFQAIKVNFCAKVFNNIKSSKLLLTFMKYLCGHGIMLGAIIQQLMI